MSFWATAYDLPHLAGADKKVAYIPALDYRFGKHADAFREEGSLTVPAAWERLSEVVHVDPSDHSNDVGSVIHVYQTGKVGSDDRPVPVASWVVGRLPDDLNSKATGKATLSGKGLTAWVLDRLQLRPYDYPRNPTRQPDWIFGAPNGSGLIQEGDFEEPYFTNGGFEEGNANQWQGTDIGGGFGSGFITAANDPAWAEDGDWYAQVTAFGNNGGARRSLSGLIPGEEYTVVGFLRGQTSGVRLRVGVQEVESASHTNAYEDNGYWWAEVGNAAENMGSTTGSWQETTLTFIAASTSVEIVVVYVGGAAPVTWGVDTWSISGLFETVDGWRMRVFGNGTYTTVFTQTTSEAYTGVGSLMWKGFEGPHTSPTGQIMYGTLGPTTRFNATVGRMYTARMRVKHDEATTQTLIMSVRRETPLGGAGIPSGTSLYLATQTLDVPADTWVEFQVSFEADVSDLSLNIRYYRSENTDVGLIETPLTFVDRVSVWEGLPAITLGDLSERMFANRAPWLSHSYTTTHDSANQPWDETRGFSPREGDTLGQIFEAAQRLWGYVVRVRFDRVLNEYFLDIYNPGWVEEDHSTTTTGMLLVGSNILGGETVVREPEGSVIRVTTDSGAWIEATNTDLYDTWGEADVLLNAGMGSDGDLTDILTNAHLRNVDQMVTVQASMTEHGATVPLKDFDVHHSVGVELGASNPIPRSDMVVTSIVVSGGPSQHPEIQVYVNSDAFASTGAAALAEAVRRLLRRTERRVQPAQTVIMSGEGGGAGGGDPSIVVAASDATDLSKGKADHVATGTGDEALILSVEESAPTTRIVLTEGGYHLDDVLTVGSDFGPNHVHGMGSPVTFLWGEVTVRPGSLLSDVAVVGFTPV